MIAIVLHVNETWMLLAVAPTTLFGTLTLSACAAILANAVSAEREGRVMRTTRRCKSVRKRPAR
ncbi:MAG TPA: hypothetical protein VLI93_11625 [Acetobacteraceae bacterium]|nr:hypothetical protein [Acetobacteraceae bacterium]